MNAYLRRAALTVFAPAVVIACASDDIAAPSTADQSRTLAVIELEGTRPAFYVQREGQERTRIHFNGAVDEVPGNSPLVPALTDANILTMRSAKWSPDGSRIAFVATLAADQAEVIVMNADGSNARVVSPNAQYVLGDVDWSPDGSRLVYVMSTRPNLGGLEIFVSDVSGAPRVTQVTTGSGYRGLGGTVRFASGGTAVWISQVTGEGGPPLFEQEGAVRRVDIATGAIAEVREGIVGEVQAVAHDGTFAMVLRRKSATSTGYDARLVRVPLAATGSEQVLVDGGELGYARLTTTDAQVLVFRGYTTFSMLGASGGAEESVRGSGATILSVDVR